MKKLFIAFSVIVITLFCSISAFAADTDDSGMWEYQTYGSGVELTRYNDTQTDVYVPSKIEEGGTSLSVVKLGDELFKNKTALNSVTLGEGITEIGASAFEGATNLVCIVTPDSLTTIGDNAFSGCTNFNSVILYDAVKSIGENVFDGCNQITVYCNPDTTGFNYVIENKIEYKILNIAEIPETYTLDGVTYYLSNGEARIMSIKTSARKIIPAQIKGVPVTTLGDEAITAYSSSQLMEIQLPDTIVKFPERCVSRSVVYWCSEGSPAHRYMEESDLQYLLVEYGDAPQIVAEGIFTYYIIDNKYAVLKSCSTNASGTIVVPEKINQIPIKYIYVDAFLNCRKITEVKISDNISDIFSRAFQSSSIRNVNIPSSVSNIRSDVFLYCYYIENIELHDGIRRIEGEYPCTATGIYSFPKSLEYLGGFNCQNISEILYPESAIVASGVFGDNISKVIISKDTQQININAFSNINTIIFSVARDSAGEKFIEENNVPLYYFAGEDEPQYISDDYFEYILLNGKVILTHCYNLPYNEQNILEVPEYIQGYPVEKIQEYAFSGVFSNLDNEWEVILPETINYIGTGAFSGNECLTKINIPQNIKIINDSSFGGTGIKTLELPSGLERIGKSAFSGVPLTNVEFPDTLKFIDEFAFEYSGLKTLVYPAVTVGEYAFQRCNNLEEVRIDRGVTTVPERVFQWCENLKKVYFPNDYIEVDENTFTGCPKVILIGDDVDTPLRKYAARKGLMYSIENFDRYISLNEYSYNGINYFLIENYLSNYGTQRNAIVLSCDESWGTEITIPENVMFNGVEYEVTCIGDNAFESSRIVSCVLPETIQVIGASAFNCSNLVEINLPSKLQFIGSVAFAGSNLSGNLILPEGTVDFGAFATTQIESVVIPEGVTVLEDSVFFSCVKLKSVSFPSTLKKIGNNCFFNMTSLEQVIVQKDTELEYRAFAGLPSLRKVVFSEGFTRLEQNFDSCENLSLVYLPKSIEYIDYNAFNGCPKAVFCVYENSYSYEFCKKRNLPYFILEKTENPEITYGGNITGVATYIDGTAASGATVEILYDDGTVKETVTTDENGNYEFTYAEVGRYTIRVTDNNGNTASEIVSVKRMNAFDVYLAGDTNLILKKGYNVSGTVSPETATVTISDTNGNVISTVSTANGTFEFANITRGEYIVKAETENGSKAVSVYVSNEDVTVNIVVEAQSSTVTGDTKVENRDGTYSSKIWVHVDLIDAEGNIIASAKTDADGRYTFEKIPAGIYNIVAKASEMRPAYGANFDKSFELTGYGYIEITEAKEYNVSTIILREEKINLTEISGKITANGSTQDCQVILTNESGDQVAVFTTDKNGKYLFTNIPDGMYCITAITKADGMGYTVITIDNGIICGSTDIKVAKSDKISKREATLLSIPDCNTKSEALMYKEAVMAEKEFYDSLSEKERKELSEEWIEKLFKLVGLISNSNINTTEGVTVSNIESVIAPDEIEETINFTLTVDKVKATEAGEGGITTEEEYETEKIKDKKGKNKKIAQYYDITLAKDGQNISNIQKQTETNGKLLITMEIPEEYRGHKQYSFIHMHNGEAVTLVDLDDNPDTVTFEIDKFSTFALAYSDVELVGEVEETDSASITYNAQTGKITVSSTENATLYIATYNGETLSSVVSYDVTANAPAMYYDFASNQAAFVWNENLKPLCKKFTLNN